MIKYKSITAISGILFLSTVQFASAQTTDTNKTYTLNQLLQAAFQNPVNQMRWNFAKDNAARNVSIAKTGLYPTLSAAVAVRDRSNSDFASGSDSSSFFERERARALLTLNYPIFNAGKSIAALHAARAGAARSEYGIIANKVSLLNTATTAYYSLLREQRAVEAGAVLLKAAREHLRNAQSRFDAGGVTKLDTLTAQSTLAAAESDVVNRQALLEVAQAKLSIIMGYDPESSHPVVAEPPSFAGVEGEPSHLLSEGLTYSPALKSAKLGLVEERSKLSVIRAERSPLITIQLDAGYAIRRNATNSNAETGGGVSRVTLNISLPILEGPAIKAREQTQKEVLDLQTVEVLQLEYSLKEQIMTSSILYRATIAKLGAAKLAKEAADEAYRLANERYQVGKGNQIELLDALKNVVASQDNLSNVQNERDVSAQNLRWLIGLDRPEATLFGEKSNGSFDPRDKSSQKNAAVSGVGNGHSR